MPLATLIVFVSYIVTFVLVPFNGLLTVVAVIFRGEEAFKWIVLGADGNTSVGTKISLTRYTLDTTLEDNALVS